MAKGVWVAFKDNRIIGYVMTEAESISRVKRGQADYFAFHEFQCDNTGAINPYLKIKEEN